jgi:hypothetical protein
MQISTDNNMANLEWPTTRYNRRVILTDPALDDPCDA